MEQMVTVGMTDHRLLKGIDYFNFFGLQVRQENDEQDKKGQALHLQTN